MRTQVTFYERTDAVLDEYGATREGFAAGDTVWAHVAAPGSSRGVEATRMRAARYASPISYVLTVYPHASCVAGNRLLVDGVTYTILGVDTTGDMYTVDLAEVI